MSDKKFAIILDGEIIGEITSKNINTASKKATTCLPKELLESNTQNDKETKYEIKEIYPKHSKLYKFSLKRTKLQNNVDMKIGDKTVTYAYKNEVTKI